MKYRLINGKPVLYSIGVDRDDDGGQPPMVDGVADNASVRHWKSTQRVAELKAIQAQNGPSSSIALPDGDWVLWPPIIEPLE